MKVLSKIGVELYGFMYEPHTTYEIAQESPLYYLVSANEDGTGLYFMKKRITAALFFDEYFYTPEETKQILRENKLKRIILILLQ